MRVNMRATSGTLGSACVSVRLIYIYIYIYRVFQLVRFIYTGCFIRDTVLRLMERLLRFNVRATSGTVGSACVSVRLLYIYIQGVSIGKVHIYTGCFIRDTVLRLTERLLCVST